MARFGGSVPSVALGTRAFVLLGLAVLILPFAFAQQQSDGSNNLPPFGGFSGNDFDIVSLQNGNLHISVPILSVPQRGGKPIIFMFLYDTPDFTKIYVPASPPKPAFMEVLPNNTYQGWGLTNSLTWGAYVAWQNNSYICNGLKYSVVIYGAIDSQRAKHPAYASTSTAPCFPAESIAPTLDGSGILVM